MSARDSSIRYVWRRCACLIPAAVLACSADVSAQEGGGIIRGTVSLAQTSEPIHGATVLLSELRRTVTTDENGHYEIKNVPPGSYELLALREHLTTERKAVTVIADQPMTVDFSLAIGVHEELTVTANPTGETTVFEAFSTIRSLDSVELTENRGATLTDALETIPGVSKRSFGPGSARPIIRGFDGDRVLIMQDGVRTGDLSSQSADHGVTIDPAGLHRLEVVKGPATLLYGSNAIGGVVNAITPQEAFRSNPFSGVFGQASADLGSANLQAGGGGNVQVGRGPWLVWAGGAARRTGDYDTPEGAIENSATRLAHGTGGVGWTGSRAFISFGAQVEDGRYGIPFAGEFHHHEEEEEGAEETEEHGLDVDIASTRQDYRFDTGLRNLQGPLSAFRVGLNYLDYHHDEIEMEEGAETPATAFNNDSFVYRAEAEQAVRGRLSGRFGIWGQARDYLVLGEEALAPHTTQNALAAFAYEELNFGRWRLQFGGRVEHNSYDADARPEIEAHDEEAEEHVPPDPRDRSFIAFSGSAGFHVDLGATSAVVVNVTRSVRAPALEELYNFGPHVGNLAFEIGNPDLEEESSFGVDVSLRRRAGPVHGEVSAFIYDISHFVFLDFTGEIVDGLREAEYLQGDSRFTGFDADAGFELGRGAHLNLGLGYVRATLTGTDEALPRIPPFHGSVDLEVPWRRITFKPELIWAADQDRTFRDETPTSGYAVFNVGATWLASTSHATHVIAVKAYNLLDATYRLHTSFIKDLAPEMGRGVRVSYSVRFF